MGIKYNDNGTFKDIKVKVGDNIPVGAEFDYDGSTIPVGYEEVDNSWTTDTGGKFSYKQVGEINYLRFNDASITVTANNWYSFGTIPEEYRPTSTVYLTGANNGFNTLYISRITSAGSVGVYPLSSGTININGLLNWIN